MSGDEVYVYSFAASLAATFAVGTISLDKGWQTSIDWVLGLVTALVRLRFALGPPALMGFVGYPLMYMVSSGVGRYVRVKLKRERQ